MVEIKFTATTTENLIRQIVAFAEKVELKEGGKKRGKHEKKAESQAACEDQE